MRMTVAGALFLSTAVLFTASPASAAASGDMVNNNDGSMTVTWSVTGQYDSVSIYFYASGASCPQTGNSVGSTFYIMGGTGMLAPALSPSPSLLSAGSAVKIPMSMTPSQIPTGSYVACLYLNDGEGNSVLDQSLPITFAVVAPTTTTTTTAPSTTTTAASTPVTPAFTG
ncbi:MAG: hypothetical protein JHC63_01565 [Acidimicrobiia bacterium]|nr:hypothetical protein [Acidimicrobiia bacterium]